MVLGPCLSSVQRGLQTNISESPHQQSDWAYCPAVDRRTPDARCLALQRWQALTIMRYGWGTCRSTMQQVSVCTGRSCEATRVCRQASSARSRLGALSRLASPPRRQMTASSSKTGLALLRAAYQNAAPLPRFAVCSNVPASAPPLLCVSAAPPQQPGPRGPSCLCPHPSGCVQCLPATRLAVVGSPNMASHDMLRIADFEPRQLPAE